MRSPLRLLLAFFSITAVIVGPGYISLPLFAEEAIRVGSGKQLFFDHRFIAASENVSITMNRPKKLGPVLKPDRRWEDFRITSYFTVVQDGSLSRMYYSSFSEDQWNFASGEVTWRDYAFLCYAESDDGLTWRKPNLGLVEYNGSKENNIIARSIVDGTVFIDPKAPPEERYKMLHTIGPHAGGLRLSTSADGKKFIIRDKPVIDWGPDSQQNMFYDTRSGKYVAYLRGMAVMNARQKPARPGRQVVRVELQYPRDWSRPDPVLVFAADESDPEGVDFYTNGALQYPWADDAYFMFPAAYHHFPPQYGNDGLLDTSAAASRDGIQWQRIDRRAYIPLGQAGEWDAMFIMSGVGIVRYGDKVYQYYNGIHFGHGGTRKESKVKVDNPRRWGWMGAVEQRLDGFYSADASYAGGWLSTPKIVFTGRRLELNIDTSAAGSARVELRDEKGLPIPRHTLLECDEIMANNVRQVVTWKGSSDLAALADKPVQLHIQMRSAKLYAFQFAN